MLRLNSGCECSCVGSVDYSNLKIVNKVSVEQGVNKKGIDAVRGSDMIPSWIF